MRFHNSFGWFVPRQYAPHNKPRTTINQLLPRDVTHLFADVTHLENLLPAFVEQDWLRAFADFVGGVGKSSVHFTEEHGNLNPQMAQHKIAGGVSRHTFRHHAVIAFL